MVYSLRDCLFQPRNLQLNDPVMPKKLDLQEPSPAPPRPRLPDFPPIISPPNPDNPWGDPHDVDPPERNPHNNPNYSPIVTDSLSGPAGNNSVGGLLGRLLALHDEQTQGTADAHGNDSPDDAPVDAVHAAPPQELPDAARNLVRILSRGAVR